ncbi:TVP38/TMEM64 family protein [Alteribacter natronophilus]|uniref:TVP38/TMEM64 family protein n=1 Tax=Alteribacter natronophilus TaxID=2583810 RepID=UPI00110E6120|nr:TVP38/TMEM64 family protein [Alteribacter natronophilus]TMW73479.1 TVP38/TMEM64 family protein [Alteribacter natronophilus]
MWLKILIRVGVLLLIIYGVFSLNQTFFQIDPDRIRSWILSFGILAPLFYLMIFALRPLTLFPASILAVAGGLSFGPLFGPLLTYAGSLMGAAFSFWIARTLGKRVVNRQWKGRAEALQEKVEQHGFFYVLVLRILPVVNFDLVSYLSGISRIPFKTYIGATMCGIIPGSLAFTFLGASFVDGDWRMIAATVLLFAAAFTIPLYVRHRLGKKNIDLDPDLGAVKD